MGRTGLDWAGPGVVQDGPQYMRAQSPQGAYTTYVQSWALAG